MRMRMNRRLGCFISFSLMYQRQRRPTLKYQYITRPGAIWLMVAIACAVTGAIRLLGTTIPVPILMRLVCSATKVIVGRYRCRASGRRRTMRW